MLDNNLKEQLKALLQNITQPVVMTAYTDSSDTSKEMFGFLSEIESLSALVSLVESKNGAERTPSFTLDRKDQKMGICFAGIPNGHEFNSFILALLQTGGHPPKLAAEVIDQIKNLQGEFHFVTYISLTCQNCPEVVQSLNIMAVLNPNITHTMVDGGVFTDEVKRLQISAVPTIYLNGKELTSGRMTVKDILAKIDTQGAEKTAQQISEKAPFDVLVIGGGPAAVSAAIYAARKGIRTGLVTENFGGQMLNTTTIENIIAIKETTGTQFAATLEDNVQSNGVDIMIPQRAKKIIPGKLFEVQLESGATVKSKTVILATGANYRKLDIEGEKDYIGKGIAFCAHCDGPLYKDKHVAVVGGGNSAVEAAIDLAGIANHVTLLCRRDQLQADEVLQEKVKSIPNITIVHNAHPESFTGSNKLSALTYNDKGNNAKQTLNVDGAFIQIGQMPATEWLKDTVELNDQGEIVIDVYGKTSVPGIFAAGDATNVPFKQIVVALGAGATAALSAFDYLLRHN